MAISKKGKRKITVNNKIFLWWVYNEQDQIEFDGNQIKLISEDQTVYLKYGLDQIINNDRYIVVALDQNKYKVHIYCPKFEDENGIIKPSGMCGSRYWSHVGVTNVLVSCIFHILSLCCPHSDGDTNQ